MSDYGDSDEGFDSDEEWLYMDDTFDEADELAESQVPDAQPFEGPYQDYDAYEYWQDIEYLSDGGYYDQARSKRRTKKPTVASPLKIESKKRKANGEDASRLRKRQKITQTKPGQGSEVPVIVWLSSAEREVMDVPILQHGSHVSVVATTPSLEQPKQEQIETGVGKNSEASKRGSLSSQDSAISSQPVDPSSIQALAGMLSPEQLEAIKSMLQAQGLDPEALEVVLQDLIEGREPEFEEDDDEEEE